MVLDGRPRQSVLGAALLQCGQPIAYISRALTPTEQRYAQIEKECLAIVDALERFHQYTFGRNVLVHSDHKPLESILKKPLASAPRHLQGMMIRLQRYDITVGNERGKNMFLADLLSRVYLTKEEPEGEEFESVNMASYVPISDKRLEEIRQETQRDESLQVLMKVILQGWPEAKSSVPALALPFYNQRDKLTAQNGIICRGERVIMPGKLREKMKQKIHSSHMGTEMDEILVSDLKMYNLTSFCFAGTKIRINLVVQCISTKFGSICWKRRHFLLCERNYRNLWQPKGLFHPIFNDQLLFIRSVYFRSQYYSKHKHTTTYKVSW